MTFSKFKLSEESKKPHYLLIGNPVSHSVSPLMHNTALERHEIEATYHAVSVSLSEIPSLIAHLNEQSFLGANITIPHKENMMEAMDELTIEADEIGAINTIVKLEGKIIGHNTDAHGFAVPLEDYHEDMMFERVIVFGSGGATKAIIYALREMGYEEIVMVSRRPERYKTEDGMILCSYDSWIDYVDEAELVINATPLGMTPNIDASPINDDQAELLQGKLCYDIVYNPRETKFLRQAKHSDAIPIGGLDMLIHQGAESFRIWTGKEFPLGLITQKLDDIFPN
jgi:shikimate dehydrogenase